MNYLSKQKIIQGSKDDTLTTLPLCQCQTRGIISPQQDEVTILGECYSIAEKITQVIL